MKKVLIILSVIVVLLGALIASIWYRSYNGEIEMNNQIENVRGDVHAAMGARYEKVTAFIDAIQGANATVNGYLGIIRDARTAFANAISTENFAAADEAGGLIDSTFVNLLSYMEDNPSSYNTVNLYSGFMGEFSASTNTVLNEIRTYNASVRDYNTHIQRFPNKIFLSGKVAKAQYDVPNYNAELPTFN